MAVSKRLRYEILRRDNFACRYCRATDVPLTIDHVKPVALGGTDDASNTVAACADCNSGKSSSAPDAAVVEQVSDDAIRWAKAMELAAQKSEAARAIAEDALQPWFNEWFVWARPGRSYDVPMDAASKLNEFLAAGLPMEMMCEAARIACRARGVEKRFAYFVGVANNKLTDLQAAARELIDGGAV